MMTQNISISCIITLLLQLIFLSITIAQQDRLSLTLREDNGNAIVLNWQKTKQLLANKHMPFWIAQIVANTVHHEYIPDFMATNVGDFVMYQDLIQSSAVVYFHVTNSFYGNIGLEYFIDSLPLEELKREHNLRGSMYVKKREFAKVLPAHTQYLNPLPNTYPYEGKDDGIDKSQPTVLYPEMLVLITHDVVAHAREISPTHTYTFLMVQYLSYFNTVSMLFEKLSTNNVKIYLNIAGIVVEDQPGIFHFTRPSFLAIGGGSIDATTALLYLIPQYLKQSQFPVDSYDLFFVSTGYPLSVPVKQSGFATPQLHIYDMRIERKPSFNVKRLGTIVECSIEYPSFTVAVQRIAWLMNIKQHPMTLEWSAASVQDLERYATRNRNRCFLLNYPRSLHPFGRPVRSISSSHQCACYGFTPVEYKGCHRTLHGIGANGCSKALKCEHPSDQGQHHHTQNVPSNTPLPLDGTPCDVDKVCWERKCQHI